MTHRPQTLAALFTAFLASACELFPCELDPDSPACDTEVTASATATDTVGDTDDDTDGPPGPCPGVDALWTACGDGSTTPSGQVCDGWPCVEADSPEGADVCAQVCTYPGQDCYLQVPYCEDPMSSGQVLFGVCVADEAAPAGYGACVEPCSVDADCTFPGEVCGVVDDVAACVWPTAGPPDEPCAPPPWSPWGTCEGEGPGDPTIACASLGGSSVVGPTCPADGEPCSVTLENCETGEQVQQSGECVHGVCLRTCASASDCPYLEMACLPFGEVPVCSWPW